MKDEDGHTHTKYVKHEIFWAALNLIPICKENCTNKMSKRAIGLKITCVPFQSYKTACVPNFDGHKNKVFCSKFISLFEWDSFHKSVSFPVSKSKGTQNQFYFQNMQFYFQNLKQVKVLYCTLKSRTTIGSGLWNSIYDFASLYWICTPFSCTSRIAVDLKMCFSEL